jgi:molybdopterin/thiamine biosynthesis adenylyltransferase/rhodanese-related sulfurtransferase
MKENIQLSPSEMARYARHIAIPEFNVEGQKKLKAARVLVIGSGGLGSPLLLYLAAAGVGKIGIVDFDRVDESNLQRQVLFSVDDVGKSKAETARKRLLGLNPHIEVVVYDTQFTKDNALEIIKDYDVVADGTDNFPTRYLVNDACVLAGKTNVYASIFRFEGQVSVFNHLQENGERGPNYRDMFPEPPPPGLVPNCAEGGVLGVLPGIIGSMQASEVIKVITGVGEPLAGRLFLFDAATFTTRIVRVSKNPDTKITELINYEQFCGLEPIEEIPVKEITVAELEEWRDKEEDFQLIDVREPYEYDIVNIKGKLIPLGQILNHASSIERGKKVVVHCRSGKRSADAIRELQKQFGFTNLYNLKGGVLAYAKEIDQSLPVY